MEQTYEFDGRTYTHDEVVRALRRDNKEQERNRKKALEAYHRKKTLPVSPEPQTDPLPVSPEPQTDPLPVSPEPQTDPLPVSPETPKDLGNGSQSVGGRITTWNGRPWVPIRIPTLKIDAHRA